MKTELAYGYITYQTLNGEVHTYSFDNLITRIDLSLKLISRIIKIYRCDKIIYLDLKNNELVTVPNFRMHSLQELWLSGNKLTSVPNFSSMPALQNLLIGFNKLTSIPDFNYMPLLRKLSLAGNHLSTIPDFTDLPRLEKLWLYSNRLRSVPNFTNLPNLVELALTDNQLTTIPDFNNVPTLRDLSISSNQLTTLPISIANLRNVTYFVYNNNPIEYINPVLLRWINQVQNHALTKKLNIYTDDQNVHNRQIQESMCKSIYRILETDSVISEEICIDQIMIDDTITVTTKQVIAEYTQNKEIHSVINITFGELLRVIWNIIQVHPDQVEIKKCLNSEMTDSICKCFTGRLSRLVNTLNGFDPRVEIRISNNEAIGNIIIMTRNRILDNYSVQSHRDLFRKEMIERNFDQATIEEWLQFID
jgi:hypothetical protein